VATGTVQLVDDKIAELFSASQLVRSFSNVAVDVFISSLYPVMAALPVSAGGLQSITMSEPLSVVVGALGCDGTVKVRGMEAPLPSEDVAESPMELIAVTLTMTLSESARLNGLRRRVATGTVQLVDVKIAESFSASQLVRSF